MVSREHKSAGVLHEKLQLLRSITNSQAQNDTSIIVDASKYIQELKEKVQRLNQVMEAPQPSTVPLPSPAVTVDTLVKGFLINAYSEKSCPGLLEAVLEAFEEMGLDVLEARVSCSDRFQLQAVGRENEEGQGNNIDARAVKHTVLQAIKNWTAISDHE